MHQSVDEICHRLGNGAAQKLIDNTLHAGDESITVAGSAGVATGTTTQQASKQSTKKVTVAQQAVDDAVHET